MEWKGDHIYMKLSLRQTPQTGSGVVTFTDLAAQVQMQKYIYRFKFCYL